MKKASLFLIAALSAIVAFSACSQPAGQTRKASLEELQAGFQNPPKESRVRVWWHWMGDDVTESGIRADFDWFKRVGIVGFHQFNLGGSQGDAVYMSDVWKDIMNSNYLVNTHIQKKSKMSPFLI